MPHYPHTQKQNSALACRLTELMEVVDGDGNRFVAAAESVTMMYMQQHGMDEATARQCAAEAVIGVLDEFGSEKIHAPTPESLINGLARLCRDEKIRAMYRREGNGKDNAEQLALEYSDFEGLGKISRSRVLQIVNGAPRRYAEKPEAFTSVKLHRDGPYQLLKDEAFARGGVPLHEVLAVVVVEGLKAPQVQAALAKVFGEQMTLGIAGGEQDRAA